jgi:hypothetical protein
MTHPPKIIPIQGKQTVLYDTIAPPVISLCPRFRGRGFGIKDKEDILFSSYTFFLI